MKTAFIIHGTWWSPEWNWFPYMKQELENKWYRVFIPVFPTPDNQSLESWLEIFEQYEKYVDEETIFIAHSVWPAFVLSVLEQIDIQVKACYFVSWFLWNINIPSFDELNDSFVNKEFNWEKINENCKYFYMCHGDDDPYVPLQNAKTMADNLWVDIDIIEWGGHLNSESGYIHFAYLLEKITWKHF
jgi:predicted alpha/beta hydrolase family esterase